MKSRSEHLVIHSCITADSSLSAIGASDHVVVGVGSGEVVSHFCIQLLDRLLLGALLAVTTSTTTAFSTAATSATTSCSGRGCLGCGGRLGFVLLALTARC
jgi:hypothetical protein